jgi:cytochrome c-type biogenesis protein CcmH
MPELIIIIVAFLLLILLVVWGHFIKQSNNTSIVDNSHRDDTNVRLYHEHKAEIEKDFSKGSIDEENYQYLLEELDKSLLQDIEENKKASQGDVIANKNISIFWPITLTAFVLVFSFIMYNQSGAYEQLSQPIETVQQQQLSEEDEAQKMIDYIKSLIDLTVKEPDNSDAWYGLGQSFVNIGEFDKAVEAYDQVIRIEGETAELFGAKAQAYYYKENQTISPVVKKYIDKALAIDPVDASTNILIGMHNFMTKNYEVAIKHWEIVINSGKTNVNAQALTEAVAEAKSRLLNPENYQQVQKTEDTSGPQLTVNVDVSEEIQNILIQGQDKTVFIYAISSDTQNGRMPVAAVKIKASDLPTSIVLNNAKAMSPQAKIGDVENVHIYAVISASGSVGIKPGDYKAELFNVSVSITEPLSLVIDTIVP